MLLDEQVANAEAALAARDFRLARFWAASVVAVAPSRELLARAQAVLSRCDGQERSRELAERWRRLEAMGPALVRRFNVECVKHAAALFPEVARDIASVLDGSPDAVNAAARLAALHATTDRAAPVAYLLHAVAYTEPSCAREGLPVVPLLDHAAELAAAAVDELECADFVPSSPDELPPDEPRAEAERAWQAEALDALWRVHLAST